MKGMRNGFIKFEVCFAIPLEKNVNKYRENRKRKQVRAKIKMFFFSIIENIYLKNCNFTRATSQEE